MADIAALILKISSKQAERTIRRVDRGLSRMNGTAKDVQQTFGAFGAGMSVGFTAPFALAARTAIQASAQFEKARVSFGVFVGDVGKGAQVFDDIVQKAAKTPLTVESLSKASELLLATGSATADNLLDTLDMLGNAARADSTILQRLALNFSQVATQGKLTAREMRDFAIAGIPIKQELAKNLGITVQQVEALVSKSKIGFKEVSNAFKTMSQEGGKFAGLMDKLSKTLIGKWTTAVDNVRISLAQLADLFRDEFKMILDMVINTARRFQALDPRLKKLLVIVAAIVAAIGPVMLAIAGLGAVFAGIAAFVTGIAAIWPILLGVAGALGVVTLELEGLRRLFGVTWKEIGEKAASVGSKLMGFIANWRENFNIIIKWLKENWSKLWRDVVANMVILLRNIISNFKVIINGLAEVFGVLVGYFAFHWKKMLRMALNELARWAIKVGELVRNLAQEISKAIKRGLTGQDVRAIDIAPLTKFIKGAVAGSEGELLKSLQAVWDNIKFVPLTEGFKWTFDMIPKLNLNLVSAELNKVKTRFTLKDWLPGYNVLMWMLNNFANLVAGIEIPMEDDTPSQRLAGAFEAGSSEAFNLLVKQRDPDAKKVRNKNLKANEKTAFRMDEVIQQGIKILNTGTVGSLR